MKLYNLISPVWLAGFFTFYGGGKGGGSSAPPAPDYTGAAQATAAGNKETALTTGALNRPTQVTPYGSTTWSLRPGADANNPQPGDWVQTQTLAPEQQQLLDLNNQNSIALQNLATKGVSTVDSMMGTPLDTSKLAAQAQNVSTDPNQFEQARQAAQTAAYNRATQFYDDRYAKDEAALQNKLLNQGLDENSAAYKNQMLEFNRNKNAAYADATDRAVAAGGTEQSRMLADLLNSVQTQQNLRNNSLQEAVSLRELPLNEVNAMRTGSQVTNPQFSGFAQVQPWQGADLLGAQQSQYNTQSQQYAAQQAQLANQYNTYGNLAAAALMSY